MCLDSGNFEEDLEWIATFSAFPALSVLDNAASSNIAPSRVASSVFIPFNYSQHFRKQNLDAKLVKWKKISSYVGFILRNSLKHHPPAVMGISRFNEAASPQAPSICGIKNRCGPWLVSGTKGYSFLLCIRGHL